MGISNFAFQSCSPHLGVKDGTVQRCPSHKVWCIKCAKLRGLRGSRGLEKLRGSWVVGRGTWVTLRGSWVNLRGSWVLFTDNFA